MSGLTAKKVKALNEPGLYGDGGTLYLRVWPGGSKSWVQRLTIDGRRHDLGLGGYPLVSLPEARDKAIDNRRAARNGGDPLAAKREAKAPTFREAADRACKALSAGWRSPNAEHNFRAVLDSYAMPIFGNRRLDTIGRDHVLRALTPIWTEKPAQARKLRQAIRSVLSWAEAHGHVAFNVAGAAISGALPAVRSAKSHHRALPHAEIPAAFEALDATRASLPAKLLFKFVVLTAVRSGEARGATWDEIDLDSRTWIIPAERTKTATEHRVPLSDPALAVLEAAWPLSGGRGFCFPSPQRKGRPLNVNTLVGLLQHIGLVERTTVHGFRSSFRDWCAETGRPREIAEAALAHAVKGVESAYFRSDLFERRRRLMDDWASYLTGETGKVVRLDGRRG